MTIRTWGQAIRAKRHFGGLTAALAVASVIYLVPVRGGASGLAQGDNATRGGFCSATADAVFEACEFEVRDDFSKANGICINVSDGDERSECSSDAKTSRTEGFQTCREQREARGDVCESLGEDRYEPDFNPALFDDDFTRLTNPNRYFPIGIGNKWGYAGGSEAIAIEVRPDTKLIEGVRCIVVNDRVTDSGNVVEDTDDWFAQNKDGDVYYCGEEVKDFETFNGDRPRKAELVSIEGSFKVGRDGDKPGILFRDAPLRGEVYRQEFSLGTAEDVAEVLSTSYAFGRDAELDEFVPRNLMQLLCPGNCIVTKEYSPISPDAFERKYYADGIGLILETNPETEEVVQLVSCNFDPRCATLPRPAARGARP